MLTRFDPLHDVDAMTRKLGPPAAASASALPLNAVRRGGELLVSFDVLGASPNDIEISVDGDVLTVNVTREADIDEGDEVLLAERPRGTFTRQLHLSDGLDADGVDAQYRDGVLTIRLPVTGRRKARKIPIATDGGPVATFRPTAGEPSRYDDVPEPPNELEGPEPEPPHLQRGSPRENEPAPYEPPDPRIP